MTVDEVVTPQAHTYSAQCYHCGSDNPPVNSNALPPYRLTILDEERALCCLGCQAVAQAIVDNGLTDFYRHRTEQPNKASQRTADALIPDELKIYDHDQVQSSFVRVEEGSELREASLIMEGLVCAACVWLNERHLMQFDGVVEFRVNYSTHRATLRWDNNKVALSTLLQAITEIGYNAHPFDAGRLEAVHHKEKSIALRRIAIAGVGMMQVMMLAVSLYIGEASDMDAQTEQFLRWVSLVLTLPVVLFASSSFFKAAWKDLTRGRVGMDVPVSLAILAAFSASVWATVTASGEVYFDSVNMFTFFLLLGRYLEMNARHSAGRVTDALLRLLPDKATRLSAEGEKELVSVHELKLHDHLLIKPGETIPSDATVLEGSSSVNESLLTGESAAIAKTVGDDLIAGSVNIDSALMAKVKSLGDDTVLSSIIRLLDKAQTEKPRLAQLTDKVASVFVTFILVLACGVYGYWYYAAGAEQAFWITLSVLVVTCPCALSLATPVALTTAMGALTKRGVMVAKPHVMEAMTTINRVVFDKTGTLTQGDIDVVECQVLGELSEADCIALAASLEAYSEHPIALAIRRLHNQADNNQEITFSAVKSIVGQGIQGTYSQEDYYLGHAQYIHSMTNKAKHNINNAHQGASCVYLANAKQLLACFILSDTLRDTSLQAIAALKSQGRQVGILSGDSRYAVASIAKALSISHYEAEQLPADKLAHLAHYQAQGEHVMMVGDGVNDAPVLAKANVSIAMGKGTQLAQASADIVLLSNNLNDVAWAFDVVVKTKQVIQQNIAWAIGYNIVAIPLAVMGILAPWMAAVGMSVSSLVVVLNALRLRDL